jgi:hypothetical protein
MHVEEASQTRPHCPQFVLVVRGVSHTSAGLLVQWANPLLQMKPQLAPSHVAVAFAAAGHGVHDAPHVAGLVLSTHAPAHMWKPASQTGAPHLPPRHVPLAWGMVEHAFPQLPQLLAFVLRSVHCVPHRLCVEVQLVTHP